MLQVNCCTFGHCLVLRAQLQRPTSARAGSWIFLQPHTFKNIVTRKYLNSFYFQITSYSLTCQDGGDAETVLLLLQSEDWNHNNRSSDCGSYSHLKVLFQVLTATGHSAMQSGSETSSMLPWASLRFSAYVPSLSSRRPNFRLHRPAAISNPFSRTLGLFVGMTAAAASIYVTHVDI
jgi:hypothetical protein